MPTTVPHRLEDKLLEANNAEADLVELEAEDDVDELLGSNDDEPAKPAKNLRSTVVRASDSTRQQRL